MEIKCESSPNIWRFLLGLLLEAKATWEVVVESFFRSAAGSFGFLVIYGSGDPLGLCFVVSWGLVMISFL